MDVWITCSLESPKVVKVGFKTSRKISGQQLTQLYVDVPVVSACFHLHQEGSSGGQNRCCFARLSDLASLQFSIMFFFFHCIDCNLHLPSCWIRFPNGVLPNCKFIIFLNFCIGQSPYAANRFWPLGSTDVFFLYMFHTV